MIEKAAPRMSQAVDSALTAWLLLQTRPEVRQQVIQLLLVIPTHTMAVYMSNYTQNHKGPHRFLTSCAFACLVLRCSLECRPVRCKRYSKVDVAPVASLIQYLVGTCGLCARWGAAKWSVLCRHILSHLDSALAPVSGVLDIRA